MWNELRALWNEPAPERPPGTPWWDRALALAIAPATVVEALVRGSPTARPALIAIGLSVAVSLWFRRAQPLGAVAAAFGLSTVITIAQTIAGVPSGGSYAGAAILLLPYSLLRWGSWREVAAGLALVSSTYAASAIHGEMRGMMEAVGGAVVLALEQQADRDRRQCARESVGREHREHDREPERREQILRGLSLIHI